MTFEGARNDVAFVTVRPVVMLTPLPFFITIFSGPEPHPRGVGIRKCAIAP
jgi:hypothetical protein